MSGLIEGLPDAVALRCLARVPFYLHPKLELVCRSWRAAIRSTELVKARQELNSLEDFICVCAFDPENLWQLYDPLRDMWITLPVLPSKVRHLAHFGVVSTVGKLFVLGGGSDAVDPLTGDQDGSFATNEVWSYEPITRRWAPRASMLVPRAMFACCVLDGKIVVAGGFTTCRKSISQAEIYDPEKDLWVSIPDLHHTHNSACSGVVIRGKVHVLHKGLSTVQVLDNVRLAWTVQDCGWLQGPVAVVRGVLYVMSHSLIYKQEPESKKTSLAPGDSYDAVPWNNSGLYTTKNLGLDLLGWWILLLGWENCALLQGGLFGRVKQASNLWYIKYQNVILSLSLYLLISSAIHGISWLASLVS
ncbi:hypothetical protein F0562_021245 [Nyssa sinensis]|uniref:F-box domain-containing protein n=1 Tax=Nyssa sinensis TaxID=561372 RepID=A0A5J5BLZ5_9ASTE|nr:hypothetical protein F0562_021245 [Nyssa sinensis]